MATERPGGSKTRPKLTLSDAVYEELARILTGVAERQEREGVRAG